MINLIYLDIDGVLTNELDECILFKCHPDDYKMSAYNIEILDEILEETHAKIILSTSWRNYPDDHTFTNKKGMVYKSQLPLLRKMYDKYIIGDAPHTEGCNKAYDIYMSIKNMPESLYKKINKIAILDDDPTQGLEQYNNSIDNNIQFFKINPKYGLDDEMAGKIIRYFKIKKSR